VPIQLIDVLSRLNSRIKFKHGDYFVNCLSPSERETVQRINVVFFLILNDQVKKFQNFLTYQFENSLKPNLFRFAYNIKQMRTNNKDRVVVDMTSVTIKKELERFFKEINIAKAYFNLNLQIYERLLSRYRIEFGRLNMIDQNALTRCDQILRSGKVQGAFKKFESYLKVISNFYIEDFHEENKYKDASERLKILLTADQFSKSESFYFGFFIGSICLCMVLCSALLVETNFFSYNPSDFVKFIVPVLRGTLALFIYIFFLGINVYGWETFGIDYKKIFDTEIHFSSSFQIMKRSFGFITIWLIVFCYCALSSSDLFKHSALFNAKVAMWIAPLPTFLFILYMVFPSTVHFNFEGRQWIFGIMKDIIVQPLTQGDISFRTGFAFDQMMSFMILINDFIYTLCYLENIYHQGVIANECLRFRFRFKQFLVIFSICFWGNVVKLCALIAHLSRKSKAKNALDWENTYRDRVRSLTKTLCLSFSSVIAIYNYKDDVLNATWICFTILLTTWCTHDDFVHAWGFFQTKDGLRAKLAYPNRPAYYAAMASNMVLRLTWVVGLGPSLFDHPLLNNLMPLVMAIMECFRRMIFNFFIVEYEHLQRQGDFKFISNYPLPYPMDIDMADEDTKMLVDRQVQIYLKSAFIKQEELGVKEEGALNQNTLMQSKVSRQSASQRDIIMKTEDLHREELVHFDETLQQGVDLLESSEVRNLGQGNVKLDIHMIEPADTAANRADVDMPQKVLFNDIMERNKPLISKMK
jgi:hypothetical protein